MDRFLEHELVGAYTYRDFDRSADERAAMANRAAKKLAEQNARKLLILHAITIFCHGLFWGLRRGTMLNGRSMALYLFLTLPAIVIQSWLEVIGRPRYANGRVRRTGDDLGEKGLTEACCDVVYWTWVCLILAGFFGDWAWSFWVVNPIGVVVLLVRMTRNFRLGQ
ncbi:MAG: hypothetical protein M1823_001038 [Watsoniomyces obsoletus]|nr:MAG: hypothetical protein M1823_001038 [Watsoniomyces obsoletus]